MSPDTFDLTPWQTTDVLMLKLAAFCELNAEVGIARAADLLAASLAPQRLTEPSPVRRIEHDGRAVLQYQAVLDRARAALIEAGHDPGPSEGFDARAAAAYRAFQASRGLPATGLPDAPTLAALLEPRG